MSGIRWSKAEAEAALRRQAGAQGKPLKYHNKKTAVDGILFDSKKEAFRYHELKLMQQAGLITDLRLQKPFPLIVNAVTVGEYRADFTYVRTDPQTGKPLLTVEDVKGVKTALYQFKKRVFEAIYSIRILET